MESRRNDARAAAIVFRHQRTVLRRARRLVGAEAADDIAAEVFEAVATTIRQGRGEVVSPAWLMTVTRNRAVDHLRARERERAKVVRLAHDRRHAESIRVDEYPCLRSPVVRAALARCDPRHRQVLVLRYVEGRSAKETGTLMELSPTAVDSLARRALQKLRYHYLEAA